MSIKAKDIKVTSTLPEPVFDGCGMAFIFFGDEEPDKLGVTHPRLIVQVGIGVAELGQPVDVWSAAGDGSGEDSVDHFRRQRCSQSKTKQKMTRLYVD